MNARFLPLDAFIPKAARIGLCTAVLLPAIAAQTPFGPIISLNQPARSPGSMMVEDVNGDGRLDLIYSDNGRDEIMWVERLATDEFAPPKQLTQLSSGISVVRRGDIDGDGDADLIGMGAQHGLLWIERTAQGFRAFPQVVGPWLRSVTDLQLADIDADGDLDVVLARHHNAVPASAALVSFLRNDGTGNFGSQTIVYGGSTPNLPSVEFIAEDLSGDGATELIAAHNGQVFVLPNAGDGSFQSPVVLDSGAGPMLLEDVTGDGLSDLVVASAINREIRLYQGMGGLGFASPTRYASTGYFPVLGLQAGDLDLDGQVDVVAEGFYLADYFRSLGPTGLSPAVELPLVSFTPPPILGRLILDDLDGDSNTDIVRVEGRNSVRYVGWYQNQGSGGATSFAPVTRLSHYDLSAPAITAADVNGDGDYEVIRGDTLAAGTLSIHFHGPAAPGRPIEVKWQTQALPAKLLAGDLNSDGLDELLVIDQAEVLWVLPNLGTSGFGPGVSLGSASLKVQPRLGDLDGDGDLDLVAASPSRLEGMGYDNLGGGNFGPGTQVHGAIRPISCIRLGDIDSDGSLDLAFTEESVPSPPVAGRVSWIRNLGTGFGLPIVVSETVDDGANLVVGDWDGDGLLDMLWSPITQSMGVWSKNLGGGSFAAPQVLTPWTIPRAPVELMDMDADGDLDYLIHGSSALAMLNDGTGGIAGYHTYFDSFDGTNASQVYFEDLNADGYVDVLGTRGSDHDLVIRESELGRPIGTNRCGPAIPNFTGQSATMTASGSARVTDNRLTLKASDLYPGLAYFLVSRTPTQVFPVPGALGRLCVGGAVGRFARPGEVSFAGSGGTAYLRVDLTSFPTPNGNGGVLPGETWHFQAWYRDFRLAGGFSSNFTDALEVTFQ